MRVFFPAQVVVRRELMASLRQARTYLFLVVVLMVATCVTLMFWPSGSLSVQLAAQASQVMFGVITAVLFTGCALLAPLLGAASIVSEREQDTFDLLYLTLLRPRTIVFGKLINTCGIFFLVILAAFPVYASALFAVGMDLRQLLFSLLTLLMTTALCAVAGMLASAFFKRTVVSLIVSYCMVAFLLGGPRYLYEIYVFTFQVGRYGGIMGGSRISGTSDWFTVISPTGTLVSLYLGNPGAAVLAVALGFQGLLCIVGTLIASRWLRRQAAPKTIRAEKPIDDARVLERRRKQWPFYLIDPLRRRPAIEDGRNPMLVREVRWGFFAKGTTLIRVFYVLVPTFMFLLIAITTFAQSAELGEFLAVAMCLELLVLGSLGPILMANSFTKEHELGNIDMLRMTMLSPREVVVGKAFAAMVTVCPIVLAIFISSLLVVGIEPRLVWLLVGLYVTMPVCALLAVSLAMRVSLTTRKTRTAIIAGVMVNAFVFLIIGLVAGPLLDSIFGQSTGYRRYGPGYPAGGAMYFGNVETDYSFVGTYLSPIVGFYRTFGSRETHWTSWLISQAFFVTAGILMLTLSVHVFRSRHMRDA